jgi:diacylglycerol O-acyltransferase
MFARTGMRQLSALDTQFLNIESATTAGHVGGVITLDPSTSPEGGWDLAAVRTLLAARLHLSPVFRQRLLQVPFGLTRPYWADDPAFDLEFHLHELALPAPGSKEQLGALVARLHARPLDLFRPPWEMYVITGLADGRAAVYTKVHHAAIDGVTGAELLTTILDLRPEPRTIAVIEQPFAPVPLPSWLSMLGRGMASLVTDQVGTAVKVPPALRHLGAATRHLKAPRTPLNQAISAHRRFTFASLPMADIKAVRQCYGGTVNDIVMVLCTSALRRWLLDHDALPDAPLVAAVPVSVRQRGHKGGPGNEISVMFAELPTQVADPETRLAAMRESMDKAKARFDAVPATLFRDLAAIMPTTSAVTRPLLSLAAVPPPLFNLFVSNVPGPRVALYFAGAKVEGVYPVSAITSVTGALNITVFTRKDSIDFGLIACPELVPDVSKLVDYLADALDELVELSRL